MATQKKYDMYVEKITNSGSSQISLEASFLRERKLMLFGEIDEDMSNRFLEAFLYFEQYPDDITIYINSCGGRVDCGMTILDLLRNSKCNINLIVCGEAASMAAVIFAAGCNKNGKRYMLPSSKLMVHQPLISGGLSGNCDQISDVSKHLNETRDKINLLLSEATGKDLKEIQKVCKKDTWFTATEAIEFGLCDELCHNILLN